MHFSIIWEHIQPHLVAIGIALIAFLATITIFIPKNTKLYKFLTFLTKKK
jgi:hypothetical protein